MYEREDWTLFRTLQTLGQKAGVAAPRLPALVAKELADNALDATASGRCGLLSGQNGFWVEDDGDGIPGTDEEVARLFSVNRPLVSSKLLRLPSRGALGNGLRVVAGAVMASQGSLTVSTKGRTLRLVPQHATGETIAERTGDYAGVGTRIEVQFGASLLVTAGAMGWANGAIRMANGESAYKGKSSPHWYDVESFYELLHAASGQTAVDVIADLDGCAQPKAGRIAAEFKGRLACDLNHAESERLLASARAKAKEVNPRRLGRVGPSIPGLPSWHACDSGLLTMVSSLGDMKAELPIVVEAWAEIGHKTGFYAYVNRTPITAQIDAELHSKDNEIGVYGAGLWQRFKIGKAKNVQIALNIETPYMPITTDGKAPDLASFIGLIDPVVQKAINRARRASRPLPGDRQTQKSIIIENLDTAIAKASGNGEYRFSLRQLYYAVRPYVMEALEAEPTYGNFSKIIGDHEDATGADIPGMYRDSRGVLYHPHTQQEIPLGTLNVEKYSRPEWTFNKILYCEKEGFFPILRDKGWPERHDCALVTSKGYASRAARDVLDLLGETGEDLTFFCIHDADAAGTMIYQALQGATKARGARKVNIVNLGLDPAEAVAMGLQVEKVDRNDTVPIGDDIAEPWRTWLQGNRVELNAMTTPQFLEWLNAKMAPYAGKVVPPDDVLSMELETETEAYLRNAVTDRILQAADVNGQVVEAMDLLRPDLDRHADDIADHVETSLVERPSDQWLHPVRHMAQRIVADAGY